MCINKNIENKKVRDREMKDRAEAGIFNSI